MADLYQIGLSGIYSSQANLTTTAHNIANVDTDGYSRQTVTTSADQAESYGSYFIGQGSVIEGIERAYDQFAFTEYISNISQNAYAEVIYTQNSQMDTLLSDESTSATSSALEMFDAINDVADSPNTLESRIVFLETASNMITQYNQLYENLDLQYTSINDGITQTAETISTLADSIASINGQISRLTSSGQDNANDLKDLRDQAIAELSELVDVSVVSNDDNMVNIYIGNGQALVMGSSSLDVVAINGDPDPSCKELALSVNGQIQTIDGSQLGGKVGALFDTRDDVESAINQLGLSVMGLTYSINEQQKEGQTLDEEIGENLFNDINSVASMRSRVLASDDGLGSAQLSVRIDDISQLTSDEYELVVSSYDAGPPEMIEFDITNLTTGEEQTLGPINLDETERIEVPDSGFSVGIDTILSSPALQVGKSFTLRPTRLAAQEASLVETDAAKVAAASAEIKATAVETNTGDAILRVSALNDPLDSLYMDEDNALTIVITDNTGGVITYDIVDENGVAVTLPADSENSFVPTKVAGDTLTGLTVTPDSLTGQVTFSFAGIEVEMISGSPVAGDEFTLSFNETGDGDNSNIIKMAELQSQKIMNNNKSTFQDVYSELTSSVGIKTSNADTTLQSAAILLTQSFERIQSTSGVNLDEEAANLLMYQQYYSAAARVIAVAGELFETILAAAQ